METAEVQAKLDEIRGRVSINPNRLDDECIGQALLFDEVGQLAAELRRDAKIAKEKLDYEKARLQKEARTNPASFGIIKVTESAIEEVVLTHDEYRNQLAASIEASYLADCSNVLQNAVEQRKSMIKDMVTLFVHEYYSSSQDMTSEKKDLAKITEDEIMTQRRRNASQRDSENSVEDALEG